MANTFADALPRHWTEPAITINGHALTLDQALVVRTAIVAFSTEMQDPNALGEDETGRRIAAGYRARFAEILAMILEPAPTPTAPEGGDA